MAEPSAAAAFVMYGAREAMTNGMPQVEEQIKGIEQAVLANPGFAFDLAKTLIESVCRTILIERKILFNPDDDLPKLFKMVTTSLPFLPPSASGEAGARNSLRKMLGGLLTAVYGVSELRNAYGFASHGAGGHRAEMETVQALMAAQGADAIVGFLHRIHRQERLPVTGMGLGYEDNSDFNEYIDGEHEIVRILSSVFKPSEVLYRMEPETYRIALAEYKTEPSEGTEEPIPPEAAQAKR